MLPSIIRLLFCSRPAAISRRVVAIIVDAVDGIAGFFRPHVGEEIFEFKPAFANFDPASAVSVVAANIRVGAALDHASPRSISWTNFVKSCLSVNYFVSFSKQTTARARVTCFKITGSDNSLFPAFATTQPRYEPRSSVTYWPERAQATKTLICDIEGLGHE